ncbi:type II toxin-antitoxin system RelE/ParE family toxin [Chelatococcus sambhunathii]|uniref:Type II toxin-antitoxin system RelE/ParE family toxin n=1 Tax=Chelatococcus sambhunathii TaxID=363953 RepID=A0ABU1DB63_9HYPH|nr:type II toxin-antitoxin system RelE/ParE family toxin [Chelatococcus sambhunathii]MDR4305263.1 type II toxin-antitoxin system RelE/ParE family toxin [Chelatococcus sambhunathii]
MKVHLREEALDDLADIRSWYAERNRSVARAFMARVQARLGQLADFPELAATEAGRPERQLFVAGTPLIIVYRVESIENLIDVIAIVDARRHPSIRSRP